MDILTHYFIALLVTSIVHLSLAAFVLFKGIRKRINQTYALYSASIAIWAIFEAFGITAHDKLSALFLWRLNHMGVIFIPIGFVHFVYCAVNITGWRQKLIPISYIVAFIFVTLNCTKLLILEVVPKFSFRYFINPGLIYYLFFILWVSWAVYGLFELFSAYFKSAGANRNQMKYFCWSMLIAYMGGIPNFFPTFNIEIPILMPFGTYAVSIYAFFTTYAIIKYRLMDIKIAFTRAGIFAIVYSLILVIPFVLVKYFQRSLYMTLGDNWWIIILFIGMMLATFGPFIYTSLRRRTENILLKEQRRYQNTLKQASIGMTRIRDLTRLLNLIAHIVTRTVKIAYIGIYIYHEEAGEYILQVCRDKGRRHLTKFPQDNPLIAWLMLHKKPLLYEEIKRLKEETHDATHIHLEENMRSLSASVVIPCLLQDRIIGFFALGEKLSGQIYTAEDLNVFQILASQAALAIENALFFEEAKVMQEQIAQAEKMATIGTMADGLSHQINNRFHALSLIAADTIDTIKMTDTSNCSAEVKEAFNQISHALERVRANVMQGGEVVRGMLKYTRKGDEGLEPLTLDQILDSTLEMVQYKVKLSEIDIIRNYPKDHPKIRGNSVQLQEALFNFIDNGYDSTVERKTMLKEPDYRGRLTFSALSQQENGTLLITIEDNGMGIKDADKKKLFTPFFTTKVSSRQGTGLGLYVLRRVIEDFHKGKIWFESEYGKGTKFFMQLPIAKE